MAVAEATRSYIDGLIDYYVSEAASYREIAASCNPGGGAEDTAVGMIAGCVYSAFVQSCTERGRPPELGEINDVISMVRARIPEIRGAVNGRLPSERTA